MTKPLGNGPGGLPVFPAGINLREVRLREGAFFWEEIQRLSAEMPLTALVSDLLGMEDAPKVWVFLDAPDRTVSRSVAVLAAARALSRRGRKVLVLDGDDRRPDLSTWTGRAETEGWLDFARYGASMQVCSIPLPWDDESGFMMGVGSYCPAWMTAEEANRLVSRMLSMVDYVLVSAPIGEGGTPWAAVPSIRVVCWDREVDEPDRVEEMIRDARLVGDRPKAVVAFGAGEGVSTGVGSQAPEERDGGSSPLFRWLAVALVVVLLGIAGWWFLFSGGDDFQGPDRETPIAQDQSGQQAVAGEEITETESDLTAAADEGAAAGEDAVSAEDVAGDAEDSIETVVEEPAPQPDVTVAEETPAEESTPVGTVVDQAPLIDWTMPVAADGWALHVYSLADSVSAEKEAAIMRRRGVLGAIRPWTSDDGMTWYRIYAGSFPDRSSARAAAEELKNILKTDWVAVSRLP